ncbi:MAG: hypothetical protein JST62_02745 [Bacteroidetes bacterium]|nr:hypothetical protein [Bacteroidota bacterium]
MKKYLLLATIILQTTFLFGQSSDWGPWTNVSCFRGIQYSVLNKGYSKITNSYWWNVRWRNNYNEPVSFDGEVIIDGENSLHGRFGAIKPGGIEHYTELPYKSSSTHFTVRVNSVCFSTSWAGCSESLEGWPNYAECDNGTPNYKFNKKVTNNNSPTNSSSNSSNSSENLPDLVREINEKCSKLQQLIQEKNNGNVTGSYNSICAVNKTWDKSQIPSLKIAIGKINNDIENLNGKKSTSEDLSQLVNELNGLCSEIGSINSPTAVSVGKTNCPSGQVYDQKDIPRLKTQINNIKNALGASKKEEENIKRLAEEQKEKYNSAIEKGDSAMQNGDYASAMSYYQNAQQYASTDSEKSIAQQKYNQAFEKKKDAERKERIEKQKKTDDNENIAYASASAATISAMSLFEDSPSLGFSSGKIYMGLNMEKIPIISNNTSPYHINKSYIEAPLRPGFDMGLIVGIANNKKISLYINPKFSYNLSALSEGTSGGNMEYGVSALLRGNWNKDIPWKLYIEGGYIKRVGSFHYDADAAAKSSGATTKTDDVRDGEFNYSVIRYGGGIMFHTIEDDDEYVVKAGVFYDKPSFFPKDVKPVIGFTLQGMMSSLGTLEINYSPNYFIGGNLLYPSMLEKENKSYFGIKFTRTGRLW